MAEPTRDPIRIANCSGFFGDRLSAAREMVEGGPILKLQLLRYLPNS